MNKRRDRASALRNGRDVRHGQATIAYGPSVQFKKSGWHYPGGGFTTNIEIARVWAEELDAFMHTLKSQAA